MEPRLSGSCGGPEPFRERGAGAADASHKTLFVSGAYSEHFCPEAHENPFRSLYEEKRAFVLGALRGRRLRVLDVGGGYGRYASALAAEHDVVLLDLSPHMLRRALAGSKALAGRLVAGDAESLPLASETFDAAIAMDLLAHLQSPQATLMEIRRVLRLGGMLVVDASNRSPWWMLAYPAYVDPLRSPLRFLRTLVGGGILPEWQDRVRHYRRREFLRLLTAGGFDLLAEHSIGPRVCPKWHVAICTR
jgi:SAM-dependent methyltransferase